MTTKVQSIVLFIAILISSTMNLYAEKPIFSHGDNEKWGYKASILGEWLTPVEYEYHYQSEFKDNDYAIVNKDDKYAVIDLTLNNFIGKWFDENPTVINGMIVGKSDGKYGIYLMDGSLASSLCANIRPITAVRKNLTSNKDKYDTYLLGFSVQINPGDNYYYFDYKLNLVSPRQSGMHIKHVDGMLLFTDGDHWNSTSGVVTDVKGNVVDSLAGHIDLMSGLVGEWKAGELDEITRMYQGFDCGFIFQGTNVYDGKGRALIADKEIFPWKKFKYDTDIIDKKKKEWRKTFAQPEIVALYTDKFINPMIERINESKDWAEKHLMLQPVVKSVQIIEYNDGFCFSNDGINPIPQNQTTYQSIEPIGSKGMYVAQTADRAFLANNRGFIESGKQEYTDLQPIADGKPYILGQTKNGKVRLLFDNGRPVSYNEFDDIMLRNTSAGDVFYFVGGGKWSAWAPGHKEASLSMNGWDYVSEPSANGVVTVKHKGFPGTYNLFTGEFVSPVETLFDKAYKSSSMSAARQIEIYTQVIALEEDLHEGYTGSALNNIGSAYEEAGDEDTAFDYYERSMNVGNKTGEKNYKRIRNNRRLDRIAAVANAVSGVTGSVLQAVSGVDLSAASTGYEVGYGPTPNSSSASSSSGNGYSASYYQEQYANWERRAQSAYESLTLLGSRTKKGGKETSGSTMSSMSGSNYTRQKKCLREAQNEMQKIRRNANRDGVTISQSHWETVTVSY